MIITYSLIKNICIIDWSTHIQFIFEMSHHEVLPFPPTKRDFTEEEQMYHYNYTWQLHVSVHSTVPEYIFLSILRQLELCYSVSLVSP